MDNRELDRLLQVLSARIGLESPPRAVYSYALPRNILGAFDPADQLIRIHPSLTPAKVPVVLLHELCHAVLYRAGYVGVGHGVAFLATYRLLLQKARLQDSDSIESCAVANWNPWTPWPIWYRHVSEARDIAGGIMGRHGQLENLSAEELVHRVLGTMSRSSWVLPRWFTRRWTEIIADTRGHWMALWAVQRGALLGIILYLFSQGPWSWWMLPVGLLFIVVVWRTLVRLLIFPWSLIRHALSSRHRSPFPRPHD